MIIVTEQFEAWPDFPEIRVYGPFKTNEEAQKWVERVKSEAIGKWSITQLEKPFRKG